MPTDEMRISKKEWYKSNSESVLKSRIIKKLKYNSENGIENNVRF